VFTLEEIARDIEEPTGEIMRCVAIGRAVKDEEYLRQLKIPVAFLLEADSKPISSRQRCDQPAPREAPLQSHGGAV